MKRIHFTQTRILVISAVLVIGLATGVFLATRDNVQQAEAPKELETVALSLDHKTYATAAELKNDADVIVLGVPEDQGQAVMGPSPGVGPTGQPAPGVPTTEFRVTLKKAFKGNLVKGQVITVVLAGGTTTTTKYVVEDFPWLTKGKFALMYLEAGEDGKYYPLAGGAALAEEKKDKEKTKYTLPKAVSDVQEIDVTEPEL